MPVTPKYPGVYIKEVPSRLRPIEGFPTSITAFIGRTSRGPVNEPLYVHSFADFKRTFGGLWWESTMSYSVQHYFLNGGTDAIIVRVIHAGDANPANNATKAIAIAGGLELEAANEGEWGNGLKAIVEHQTQDPADSKFFNLTIQELASADPDDSDVVVSETFRNVSTDPKSARYVANVLATKSVLVRVPEGGSRPEFQPAETETMFTGGGDGGGITDSDISADSLKDSGKGLYALEKANLFNLMCIPPFTRDIPVGLSTWSKALEYCKSRRAMLIVDPDPNWSSPEAVISDSETVTDTLFSLRDANSILYYPRVEIADPLQENGLEEFAPSGVVAGIFARTDANRGVWKAPVGLDACLVGVRELAYNMSDGENCMINAIGVNALRTFSGAGNVVWGSHTLGGTDALASEWKYVPVRRLLLFIEESIYRGTQWGVFEPNEEPLWAQIRLNVGTFMQDLFREGAFQGRTPEEAYFVKCDKETTTQSDIDKGIVNILVGLSPLEPTEFVVIKIQQMAGQTAG